jgi:outer membrane protein assembly factor BamB
MTGREAKHVTILFAFPDRFWQLLPMKTLIHTDSVRVSAPPIKSFLLARIFLLIALTLGMVHLLPSTARGSDWPQWMGGPQHDGTWYEEGILTNFPSSGAVVKWRTPIGPGYSGPSVAHGFAFVMDRQKSDSGLTSERVLCVDATNGKIRWQYSYPCNYSGMGYDSGPRVTPAVADGRVYSLGAMGNLICLDVADGKLLWQKNLHHDYQVKVPQWGFSTQLLVEGPRLYSIVGGQGHAVVAFDKNTGKELWRALSSREPGYSAPIIRTINGRRQLVIRHSDGLAGLIPETGEVIWSAAFPARMGMAICTPAVSGDRICISGQWEGTAMFKILPDKKEAVLLWSFNSGLNPEKTFRTEGFNSVMSSVLFDGNQVYGVSLHGELCGLDAETGHRLWTSLALTGETVPKDKWFTAFLVPTKRNCFIFTEKGDLNIARLSPAGYEQLDTIHLCDPDMPVGSRNVIWSHPAFADCCILVRRNSELIAFSLAASETHAP